MESLEPRPVGPFHALTWKYLRHAANIKRVLKAQSAFKIVFILAFAVLFEVGLTLLFHAGFRHLKDLGGIGTLLIGRLFSLFFLGLGAMLVTSSVVTFYSTLYRSDEVPFLLVRPFRMSEIVLYKFLESTSFSSWAFFFIIVPFMLAYAVHESLSPLFALWTLLFSVPFLIVCSGIGALVTLAVVRWAPRGRFVRYVAVALACAAAAGLWHSVCAATSAAGAFQLNLFSLIPGLHLASNRLLPSWWMAEGIQSLVDRDWTRGWLLWGVLASNGLMTALCVERLGEHVFYNGWQRVVAGRTTVRRRSIVLARLDRALVALPSDVRAMLMKDVRTFFRDPAQWSQALIFFGLLAVYFMNLRSFHYHALPASWRNTIAFLNVFSVSAVMCSLGSRFVYPQLSLEGQGFWIVGLSPMSMRRVLLSKFALSAGTMVATGVVLMWLSSIMLAASPVSRLLAMVLACAVAFAVCGLSTGLGALFIDLRQRNPAAIVSGFGGTLNLVLSLGFMLAVIAPFGFIFHLHFLRDIPLRAMTRDLALASVWLVSLTMTATLLPLWLGCRSLARCEF